MKVAVTYYNEGDDGIKVMDVDTLTPPSDNPATYGLEPEQLVETIVVLEEDGKLTGWFYNGNGEWIATEGGE